MKLLQMYLSVLISITGSKHRRKQNLRWLLLDDCAVIRKLRKQLQRKKSNKLRLNRGRVSLEPSTIFQQLISTTVSVCSPIFFLHTWSFTLSIWDRQNPAFSPTEGSFTQSGQQPICFSPYWFPSMSLQISLQSLLSNFPAIQCRLNGT